MPTEQYGTSSNNTVAAKRGQQQTPSPSTCRSASSSPAMMLQRGRQSPRIAPPTTEFQQQHQKGYFGRQHHSMRPSAWTIPLEEEEKHQGILSSGSDLAFSDDGSNSDDSLPLVGEEKYNDYELPFVTPDRLTPCKSNVNKGKTNGSTTSNTNGSATQSKPPLKLPGLFPPIRRALHNSHRKKRLHYITPKDRRNNILETSHETDEIYSHPQYHQQQPSSARGNGLVLDLTSLFTADPTTHKPGPQSPSETATTAASTNNNINNQNIHRTKSPLPINPYNAPTPPPWRQKQRATPQSPVTVLSQEATATTDPFNNTAIHHTKSNVTAREDLQWDTKSQTTQEALSTERQSQALTQWLNFVLVGDQQLLQEQQQQQQQDRSNRRKTPRKRDTATPTTDTKSVDASRAAFSTPTGATSPTGAASIYSRGTTPTMGTRCMTPSAQSVAAHSVSSARTTPTKNLVTKRRQNRRFSMFQYAQSFDHAQEQAHHWFHHSPQWREIRTRIRCEVASGKMMLRDDRDLYANIGCREQILDMFLSYRPAWLTMALEVVMNASVTQGRPGNQLGQPLPTVKQLKHFIVVRVLSDSKLLSKYTQGRGSGTPSGKFEKEYHDELRPLVLYRVLVLIFFLDRAAVKFQPHHQNGNSNHSNNYNNLGNLFHSKSKVQLKSTHQVLVMFCREFLSRAGDVIKQLGRVNLHVYYKQDRLDEIDYPIGNFAIDLRDGVRLCRVLETLWILPKQDQTYYANANLTNGGKNGVDVSAKYPLLSQLRIPAISRLQKIHNVNVALAALQEDCQITVPTELQAHHIVDGQRRMVLRVVWTIVLMHCFENDNEILTLEKLEAEIAQVKAMRKHQDAIRERRQRQQPLKEHQCPSLSLLKQETDAVESVALMSVDETVLLQNRTPKHPTTSRAMPLLSQSMSRSSSFDADQSFSSIGQPEDMPAVQQWKMLLFQWCQEVCMLVEEQEKEDYTRTGQKTPMKKIDMGQWTAADLTNGRALCCLIHHYHPTLLTLEDLRQSSTFADGPPAKIQTTQSRFRFSRQQRKSPKASPDYFMRLAQKRLAEIGGIPPMMLIPHGRSDGKSHRKKHPSLLPLADEKSILVFLYHVCARLMESRHQVLAVVFVQQRYRYHQLLNLLRRKQSAAKRIWEAWCENKETYYRARARKYRRSVQIIEAFMAQNFDKLLLLQENRLERELQNLAVTPIQAQVRRVLATKNYNMLLEQHVAAIIIQAKYRQFQDYMSYQLMLLENIPAVTTIQRHWRGVVQRRRYADVIDAIILIQSVVRGAVLVRRVRMGPWRDSAICIQRIWRGFCQQLKYQMEMLDIISVQCTVRKHLAITQAKKSYHALSVVQRISRGFLARLDCEGLRQALGAAVIIQKMCRQFLAKLEFERLVRCRVALVLQRSWRRWIFLRDRIDGSMRIQTRYRAWLECRKYSSTRFVALRVQSAWRQRAKRKAYLVLRAGVILIQSTFRRWYHGVVKVAERKRALSTLQKNARRFLAQCLLGAMKKVAQRKRALLTLQKNARRFLAQCLLGAMKKEAQRKIALSTLQKNARRFLAQCLLVAMKKYRDQLLASAIFCQALARRNSCARIWTRTRKAIVCIQSRWRGYSCFRVSRRRNQLLGALASCALLYRREQKGSFKIVPHTRHVIQLSKQTQIRCGQKRIVLTNASTWAPPWRGHRQELFRHRNHVKAVRAKFEAGIQLTELPRRRIGPRTLRLVNEAAARLQAPWVYYTESGAVSMRNMRQDLLTKKESHHQSRRLSRAKRGLSRSVQSLLRPGTSVQGERVDPSVLCTVRRLHSARSGGSSPRVIQRRREDVNVARLLNLVRRHYVVSSAQRGGGTSIELHNLFDPFREKALLTVAATSVQHAWRRLRARRQLQRSIRSIIVIQSAARRRTVVRRTRQMRAAIVTIQAARKGFLARRHLTGMDEKAKTIQKLWRSHIALSRFKTIIRRIKMLQSLSRRRVAKQEVAKRRLAIVCIQKAVRCGLARSTVQVLRGVKNRATRAANRAASLTQSTTRGFLVRREISLRRASTVAVQKVVRTFLARLAYHAARGNIVKIQKNARAFVAKRALQLAINRITTVQTVARRWIALRRVQTIKIAAHADAAMRSECALMIQKTFRGFSDRSDFMFALHCLVKIQSWWRSLQQRRCYEGIVGGTTALQSLARAVVTTQRFVRGFLARQQISLEHFAATAIQRTWRCYADSTGYIFVVVSAIKMQSIFRMALAKKQRKELLSQIFRIHESAIAIQSGWRMLAAKVLSAKLAKATEAKQQVAALTIQCFIRMRLASSEFSQQSSSVSVPPTDAVFHRRLSLSQGVVRGWLARRNSNAQVRKSITLIKEAELRSRLQPSMRLGARMDRALSVLKTSCSLTEIMNIVCTIELATRFSKECCAEFCAAEATETLVALLFSCNKSLPHVELLYYIMCTLLNVCKHKSLTQHVATVETAEAFLYLIRMYGSEDAVFCSAVALLDVCMRSNNNVRALVAAPPCKKRMEGIYKQRVRKLRNRVAPCQNTTTPQFLVKQNKAKTDMLILGISYDLERGVSVLEQVLLRTL
ncbi:Abnormal spindle-like microcephaly-associated protein homolog [Seminavis robusta]|uniref:Abnormal spindle-like microcephaly-associated protein homolog n=1 Tax=Seminavis robusta TaxID=568900 RepID=A0A9N8HNW5_9STRA|nr:Abnormal spindle-like microcephaly-associated protein homolog [Seminavis robusta]|eukprot:Sro1031_g233420.1 Abnormal spindle-like microcephaly-associated protein homolog (2555) ;mRNA; f:12553-20555